MNNPFDYVPSEKCQDAFRQLLRRIDLLKQSALPEDVSLCRELDAGKMLGVLVATDTQGISHVLYAFSGQIGDAGFRHRDFVPPVIDYLDPDGYFKAHEADISRQNVEIARFEKETLVRVCEEYAQAESRMQTQLSLLKRNYRQSKAKRERRRESGGVDEEELAVMVRQSQFEKAELRRAKRRLEEELRPLLDAKKEAEVQLDVMKKRRHAASESLQQWLFDNFKVLNARGERRSLNEIFAGTSLRTPPSGAGECCAPKLLQEAYLRGWQPEAMAEYWYGTPKGGEVRRHGEYYPACRGKCLPVLGWMLQGLAVFPPLESERRIDEHAEPKVIFENDWFCVVDKPSGMLSVPGKGNAVSVQEWLQKRYGTERFVKMAHRLDQDTSGLLIAAFTPHTFKTLQSLFARRIIKKTYVADLEGDYIAHNIPRSGSIALSLSPDWLDRPRQKVDLTHGKEAVTEYEFKEIVMSRSRVEFRPMTGRTHQLRVHSASEQGLGMPIVGDRLYGLNEAPDSGRLHLHAHRLEFTFPLDGEHYCFESSVPF